MKTLICFLIAFLTLSVNGYTQQWNALGNGVNWVVRTIASHNGEIYIGGEFKDAGGDPDADYLARWDGHQWHAVAPGLNGTVWAIDFWGDLIYVGGEFTHAGNNPDANHIAMWNGTSWLALSGGLDSTVLAIKVYPFDQVDGVIYAGGDFKVEGSDGHIAVWGLNGPNWQTLGSGVNDEVWSIVIYDDHLYIGGFFTDAGGHDDVDYIAKWEGNTWTPVGNSFDYGVIALNAQDNFLFACGAFTGHVASWDGHTWTNYGLETEWGEIDDVGVLGTDLYASAWGDGMYKWNGAEWNFIFESSGIYPKQFGPVLVEGGDVYVGGRFELDVPGTNNIARWGGPFITAIEENHNTDLSLHVFPNPTQDVIHFVMNGDASPLYTITLTNVSGEEIIKQETTESEMDISKLVNGVYFFQVQTSRGSEMAKIIKL